MTSKQAYQRDVYQARRGEGRSWKCAIYEHGDCGGKRREIGEMGRPLRGSRLTCCCECHRREGT